jgi:DNA phosphorothioation-associated putative methyltransferase
MKQRGNKMDKSKNTAIGRTKASLPLRDILSTYRVAEPVIDYGCGRGADVAYLKEQGIVAIGYDPNHYPKKPTIAGMTVLNTYVLNVIDDEQVRIDVLKNIVSCCADNGRIYVTTRTEKEINSLASKTGWTPKNDGFLTKSGTFQKGFTAESIVALFEKAGIMEQLVIEDKKTLSKYAQVVARKKMK